MWSQCEKSKSLLDFNSFNRHRSLRFGGGKNNLNFHEFALAVHKKIENSSKDYMILETLYSENYGNFFETNKMGVMALLKNEMKSRTMPIFKIPLC